MWMDWNALGFFGLMMMILFWTAVLAVIILAIRSLNTKQTPTPPTPLELLERRFAAGEIDRAEFEERKQLLSRS